MKRIWRAHTPSIGLLAFLLVACASPTPSPAVEPGQRDQGQPTDRTKALTVGIIGTVPALSLARSSVPRAFDAHALH